MKSLLLLVGIFSFSSLLAQNNTYADTNAVVIHKDPRIDALAKKQAALNAAIKKASARSMRGYRLLVINTNKRNEAIDAKTKIYTYFPELKAYLIYQTPYFKLKAGNFKTRDDADRACHALVVRSLRTVSRHVIGHGFGQHLAEGSMFGLNGQPTCHPIVIPPA